MGRESLRGKRAERRGSEEKCTGEVGKGGCVESPSFGAPSPERTILERLAKRLGADRYVKRFTAVEHLYTFIFAVAARVNTIRELDTALAAHENKLGHIGVSSSVARSTFSDANNRRTPKFFEEVYKLLFKQYQRILSDSRLSKTEKRRREKIYAMDSTTIPLFTTVFRGTGQEDLRGKRKGGLKVHTIIDTADSIPQFVCITDATCHDSKMGKALVDLPPGSIAVRFKKIKQNFNLENSLRQSRNGIMIQIWSILITFLILEIIHLRVERKVAFSIMIADLLFGYIDFISFLEGSDKAKGIRKIEQKSTPKSPPITRLPLFEVEGEMMP